MRRPDDRPVAFLLFSPQGPGDAGFHEGAWADITRPVFFASGSEDEPFPAARLVPVQTVRSEVALHYYVDHPGAQHALFGLNPAGCVRATGDVGVCRSLAAPMVRAAVAFLDGHVRGDAAARAWLDALEPSPASAATVVRP